MLDKLIAKGKLPNIKKIKESGCHGTLESCLPPVTAPNWKCYSTGKNPGKLGVFWWENIDCAKQKINIPTSYSFKSGEIWDAMSEQGLKVGIINMPTTYPPKKVNGFMISGGPDSLESGLTYPKELEVRIKKEFGYRALPRQVSLLAKGDPTVIKELQETIKMRFEVAKKLAAEDNYDFIHLTIYLINVLQHFFWDDPCVIEAWEIIDTGIGELIATFPDATFLFMSDHGSNEIKCKFNINTWLEREGYLKLHNKKSKSTLLKLGITKERAVWLLTKLRLKDAFKKAFGSKITLPTEGGAVQRTGKTKMIDWHRSKAVASGQGPVYLNIPKNSKEYDKTKAEIINKLEKLSNKGVKIAKQVYEREQIYSGPYLDSAPELIIDQGDHVHITGAIGFDKVFEKPSKWRGENAKSGIFMAYGKKIANKRVNAHILDLAPTILELMDIKQDPDFDGKPLTEILR